MSRLFFITTFLAASLPLAAMERLPDATEQDIAIIMASLSSSKRHAPRSQKKLPNKPSALKKTKHENNATKQPQAPALTFEQLFAKAIVKPSELKKIKHENNEQPQAPALSSAEVIAKATIKLETNDDDSEPEEETFYCPECRKNKSSLKGLGLKFHLKEDHGICPDCNLKCGNGRAMRNHLMEQHLTKNMLEPHGVTYQNNTDLSVPSDKKEDFDLRCYETYN